MYSTAARLLRRTPLALLLATTLASAGETVRLNQHPDGSSFIGWPSLIDQHATSADGRFVVFDAAAPGVLGDPQGGVYRVYLLDRLTGEMRLVSALPDGTKANDYSRYASISADGRTVVFGSKATNLVPEKFYPYWDIFAWDRITGEISLISWNMTGTSVNDAWSANVSADGRYVAYVSDVAEIVPNDTNYATDVFVYDRKTGLTERVSVASDGTQGDRPSGEWGKPALSADGRYVVFASEARNLVPDDTNGTRDVFIHDRVLHTTQRVSLNQEGKEGALYRESAYPDLTPDGRYVAFHSAAALSPNDMNSGMDIYVRDLKTATTELITPGVIGHSYYPAISADGRFVSFESSASGLVPGDTNGYADTFLRDRKSKTTVRVSIASDGTQGDSGSSQGWSDSYSSVSGDGRLVTFGSAATNLVANDDNRVSDVFAHTPAGSSTQRANLGLAAVATPAPVSKGGTLTLTYTLSNAGPAAASNVSLVAVLPKGLVFKSAPAGCAGGPVPVCRLAKLGAGQEATFTLTARASQLGPRAITASVSADQSDPKPGNNRTVSTVRVIRP